RDGDFPARAVRAGFGLGALLSCDGAFVLGVMNAHTAGAGGIYFPSGMLDPRDVVSGRVDFDRNVRREIAEETGLSVDGIAADSWRGVVARQRVARIKVFRFHNRRRTCARAFSITSETKPSLNFPTFTSFARLPISNRGCFHSSGRSFCIFGLATAGDEVACVGRRHGGLAWSRLSLRCTIGRDSLGLRSMTLVVVSIYLAAVLFCVGTTALLLRAWTRSRYGHKGPSDMHYGVAGTALLLSAGIGVAVASQIVVALGYPPAP